jgi:hypothetical protein
MPSNHAATRTRLTAVAVRACCTCVLAWPRSRHCRKPHRRMACVCVPSIAARRAYWGLNSGVSCRRRAAWIASWWACGRTVSWHGASLARVHAWRTGHARQGVAWKRMRTTGSPETSRPGVHRMLVCPCGQRASCTSQSIRNASKSYPVSQRYDGYRDAQSYQRANGGRHSLPGIRHQYHGSPLARKRHQLQSHGQRMRRKKYTPVGMIHRLNQQSHNFLYVGGELTRLTAL